MSGYHVTNYHHGVIKDLALRVTLIQLSAIASGCPVKLLSAESQERYQYIAIWCRLPILKWMTRVAKFPNGRKGTVYMMT